MGYLDLAAHILGAADWISQRTSPAFTPRERSEHEECLAVFHAGLSEMDFSAAWEKGQQTSLDDTIIRCSQELATEYKNR